MSSYSHFSANNRAFMAENIPVSTLSISIGAIVRYLHWLHSSAMVNSAVIHIDEQVSLWYVDLEFIGSVPRSGIAGSLFVHCFVDLCHSD